LVELVFDGRATSDVKAWSIERAILTMEDPPKALGI